MSVLAKLSSALGRRDEAANVALAADVAERGDKAAVKELVEGMTQGDKRTQSDCVKALYEIGERRPALVAAYVDEFASLLANKNDRLVWGAMTALDTIAEIRGKEIYSRLPEIMRAAGGKSIIARDHAVMILAKLARTPAYALRCVKLLFEQLSSAPDNQLGLYAETTLPALPPKAHTEFADILSRRMSSLKKDSHKRRIAKLLSKLDRLSNKR